MSERLIWDNPGVEKWVAKKVGVSTWLGHSHSVGFYIDGKLKGAAVFDAFTPYECCMHLAIEDGVMVPEFALRAAFAYPFQQLKLKRLTGLVRADNTAALEIAKRNGFVEEGRKRLACGDCDEIVLGLLPEECPWMQAA